VGREKWPEQQAGLGRARRVVAGNGSATNIVRPQHGSSRELRQIRDDVVLDRGGVSEPDECRVSTTRTNDGRDELLRVRFDDDRTGPGSTRPRRLCNAFEHEESVTVGDHRREVRAREECPSSSECGDEFRLQPIAPDAKGLEIGSGVGFGGEDALLECPEFVKLPALRFAEVREQAIARHALEPTLHIARSREPRDLRGGQGRFAGREPCRQPRVGDPIDPRGSLREWSSLRQQVRRQRIAQRGIEGCVERLRGSVEVATLRIEAAADEQRFGKQGGSTRDETQVRDRRVEDTTGVLERFTSPMHASAQDAHRRDPGGAAGVEPFADAHEPIGDVDRRAIDRVSGDDLDERMVPRRDRPRVPEFGDEGLDLDVRAIGSRDFRECAQESDPGSPGRSTRDRSEGFERLIDQTESQTCFGQAGSRPVEGVDPRRERLKCDHGVEEMSPCRGGLIMDEVGPTGGRDEEAEVRSRLVAVVRAPSAHEFFGDRDLATGRMDTRALDDDACPVRPGRPR
jgi:hypothetical protein